jgi:RNA polymerase sigma factor for flagellar operon FliA
MNQARAAQTPAKSQRAITRREYEQFQPMVRRTAMRLARRVPSHVSVNDLIGCGWVGLVEALGRAAPDMPEQELEAYAFYRVRGAMLDYLRSLDPASREIRNASRRVARAISTLTQELGRPPEESEIAGALKMKDDEYRELLGVIHGVGMARLEMLDFDLVDLASEAIGPEESTNRKLLVDQVAAAIETLPKRLQQVLALYYQEDCTMREIGEILGVTESRVCQLHSEIMHRLRAALGKS